jgi:hypothetical protein
MSAKGKGFVYVHMNSKRTRSEFIKIDSTCVATVSGHCAPCHRRMLSLSCAVALAATQREHWQLVAGLERPGSAARGPRLVFTVLSPRDPGPQNWTSYCLKAYDRYTDAQRAMGRMPNAIQDVPCMSEAERVAGKALDPPVQPIRRKPPPRRSPRRSPPRKMHKDI